MSDAARNSQDRADPNEASHQHSSKPALECQLCEKIVSAFQSTSEHVEVVLGHIDDIMSLESPCHKPAMDKLVAMLNCQEDRGLLTLIGRRGVDAFCFRNSGPTQGRQGDGAGALEKETFKHEVGDFEMIHKEKESGHSGRGIRLDPDWINSNCLIRWIDTCRKEHGKVCSDPIYLKSLPAPKHRLLIDVVDECLVPTPPDASFAALSYVWGQVLSPSTTKANLPVLRNKGAFGDPDLLAKVPRTILHAMDLTRILNERYLWVDGLCIVQDDKESLGEQLNSMASIYAYASVVIVAAAGVDANYGLHGLKGSSKPVARHLEQEVFSFGDEALTRRNPAALSFLSDYTYSKRAWTLQEFFFSRRRLTFGNNTVDFTCCCSKRSEDYTHSFGSQGSSAERDLLQRTAYPAVTFYAVFVNTFMARQLTFPQDVLPSFASVLAILAKSFKGGLLCGLPEMFFDVAMLWQPSQSDMVRRKARKRVGAVIDDFCGLPSWSWAGWEGGIHERSWLSAREFVFSDSRKMGAVTRMQTYPITTWYTGADPRTGDKRRIVVEWAEWRKRYKDSEAELPSGWSKRELSQAELSLAKYAPDGYGRYVFQQKSRSTHEFWYPVPLFDPHPQAKVTNTTYLFSSVRTASLYTLGTVWAMHEHACVSLYNSENEWVGMLRLHNREEHAQLSLSCHDIRVPVHLVAISRGLIPESPENAAESNFEEHSLKERPKDGTPYEYYNVMWISWKEDVAYREALGRVQKDRWEALELSTIDLVLG